MKAITEVWPACYSGEPYLCEYATEGVGPCTVLAHERAFSVGYHNIWVDAAHPLCAACAERAGTERCVDCLVVAFCSGACAGSYHERHTHSECDALRLLANLSPEFHGGIALVMHVITTWSGYKMRVAGYEALDALARNQNIPVDTSLRHIFSVLLRDLPADLSDSWVAAIRTNAFQRSDHQTQVLYTGGIQSCFNHSCDLNLTTGVESLRAIAVGEELTFDYTNSPFFLVCSTGRRRGMLQEKYLFYCRCPRCECGDNDPFERALRATRMGSIPMDEGLEKKLQQRIDALFTRNKPLASPEEYDTLQAELEGRCMPCHYLMQLFTMGPRHPQCHTSVAEHARRLAMLRGAEELPLPWLAMPHTELLQHGARYRRPF